MSNYNSEYYEVALDEIRFSLSRLADGIECLCGAYDSMIEQSKDGPRHLLRLVADDIESLHDHTNRVIEGRCTIRNARVEDFRLPEEWERLHNDIMKKYAA